MQDSRKSKAQLLRDLAELRERIVELERCLTASQERYDLALSTATVRIWDWNPQSGKVRLDGVMDELKEESTGQVPSDADVLLTYIHPDDRDRMIEGARAHLDGSTPEFSCEHRLLHKDGSIGWRLARATAIKDEQGKIVRLLGTSTDITGQKRAEAALRITEEKLRQAQKMEAVGRLAGGVAHDFNNLLTTIMGYSDMLLIEENLDQDFRESVREIKRAGERAGSLIQQLLTFSRKQMVRLKRISLNQLIADLEKMLGRLIGEHIILVSKLDPELGHIQADTGQMEQVILNLAINACDAMPGGGTITIETRNIYPDAPEAREHPSLRLRHHVLLSVRDTGHGMDEAIHTHIFEPFFTTKGEGTGLGLATVHSIVQQYGGFVRVDSQRNRGTAFTIFLPRIEDLTEEPGGRRQPRPPRGGQETVLIVEDEDGLRGMICKILSYFGYTMLEAKNGVEALNLLEQQVEPAVDLLVTDMIMPKMGGQELAQRLRIRYGPLKVLYISGYADEVQLQREGECIPFLQKPFSPGELARQVRKVLDEED